MTANTTDKAAHSLDAVRRAIEMSWSATSSTLWTMDCPAAGQCGVSALVLNDHVGGEIAKTPWRDSWHYYNIVDGERIDMTKSQFTDPIVYTDTPSNREEAFSDTNAAQYGYLRTAVVDQLRSRD